MDEKELKAAIEKINVPKEKVFRAIEEGLNKTDEKTNSSAKRRVIFGTIAATALLGITVTSGFVHPTMNKVLAKAPFFGQIYQEFEDPLGLDLAKQNLVKELNQSITKNGVTVKLTSAYFDGNVVSITGHVSGDLEKGHNEKGEVSFDVNFGNNKDDHDPWLDGKMTDIKKKGNGYNFQWQLEYPHKTIKEKFTLPISIHYINGIKGEWDFDIPIAQEKVRTLSVMQEKSYQDEGIKVGIKEILDAKASSSLVYEMVTGYKNDDIDFEKAIDNNGNVLHFRNSRTLSESKEQDGYHRTVRALIDKKNSNRSSLTFYPTLSIADPAVNQLLNTKTFTLKSKRTDLALKINDVKQEGNKLILDYHFLGLPMSHSKNNIELLTNNLGYGFILVDQKYVSKMDSENPVPPKNHSVSRNKVTMLDAKTAHFQSVFNLTGDEKIENFKLENTILRFNFSSFIETEKMEPFTVKIPSAK